MPIETSAAPLPSLAAPLTGPVSVLVVDDDAGSLALLRAILEPLGQNVVAARSHDVAVQANGVVNALTARFGGRSGGKADLAQGGGLTGTSDEILAAARGLL